MLIQENIWVIGEENVLLVLVIWRQLACPRHVKITYAVGSGLKALSHIMVTQLFFAEVLLQVTSLYVSLGKGMEEGWGKSKLNF